MASGEVVKKIVRFKLQLSNATEPATVLKILQKLKDLDVTLEILAETGIGKTVNSFRRHKQAGEVAKALVKGWKNLVPKEFTSSKEDGVWSEKKGKEEQSCPNDEEPPFGDENNNSTSHLKNKNSPDEAPSTKRKDGSEKRQCEQQKKKNETKKCDQSRCWKKSSFEVQEDSGDNFAAPTKKNKSSDTLSGNKCKERIDEKSEFDSKEKCKVDSESRQFGLNSRSKSMPSKHSSTEEESSPAPGKSSKTIKATTDEGSSGKSQSSEAQHRKRKKSEEKLNISKSKHADNRELSKQQKKKLKMNHKNEESNSDKCLVSFESCLNYDVNDFKRKEKSGIKRAPKKPKSTTKRQAAEDSEIKPEKSPTVSPKQVQKSLLHLMDVPLPATLPELEKPSVEFYFERKAEKDSDFQDLEEDPAVFTGQRLNRKMQVYSGAKTLFLPTMMSLYQQCIRTLQNNINMLYETGGVPFELLEPVLERCTPDQLQRIEECNPIYIGVTDHLWGRHCLRDFKGYKLQEYESWKEMYLRLSEERERKLRRLTKTIVSAQSNKPKGRQVKMAFIHTVAKPPRDVRIQQEIHGTAAQQPHQLKCSVKGQENRLKSSCHEPIRSSSTSTGGSNDARKKTRVAPMMAKSLKAFKKQLGRR
ncbi:elongin-A [Oryzias latipes]|uniref:elongin-A n=1 Tax=Oryzias latipes TaxID=8090 RepID=UPI0005CB9A87|nr:elongin-A [Oryzias latipes]